MTIVQVEWIIGLAALAIFVSPYCWRVVKFTLKTGYNVLSIIVAVSLFTGLTSCWQFYKAFGWSPMSIVMTPCVYICVADRRLPNCEAEYKRMRCKNGHTSSSIK